MVHSGSVDQWLLAMQIVGYTAGTVIVILLYALVRRAARFDDPRAYGLLLWSVLGWNAGNLIAALSVLGGAPADGLFVRVIVAAAFSGAALSPSGALIMWRRSDRRFDATGAARRVEAAVAGDAAPDAPVRSERFTLLVIWLVRVSLAAGVVLALLMWAHVLRIGPPFSEHRLWIQLSYHVATFFVAGALLFYDGHVTVRAARTAIAMTAAGAFGIGASVLLQKGPMPSDQSLGTTSVALELFRQVSSHVMTLGALFFLARFRLADVFVRHSLRMIVALLLGVLCIVVLAAPITALLGRPGTQPPAALLAGTALLVAGLIGAFTLADRPIVALVDRWLFRQPDYAVVLRRMRDAIAALRTDAALHDAVTRLVIDTLSLQDAQIVSCDDLDSNTRDALMQRDVVDVGARVMVPVRVRGIVTAALTAAPRPDRPTLLAREVEFLRAAAATLGHRLDVVHREREEIDRRTHEAHLRQQLSDATLRALQAQVNPHFLFNTLNTIAHLIVADPTRAEGMTLRLADVFSHVLSRSHRPLNSVAEEMEFLRTYLTIEEARFGDRLRVSFAIDPDAAQVAIPSLILQPAVENALKHGLAPKIGPGHLTIAASIEGDHLRLTVEDDGVGRRGGNGASASGAGGTIGANVVSSANGISTANGLHTPVRPGRGGVGLRNIAERLRTLYADRASVRFEPRPTGGSRLTLRLPLPDADDAPDGLRAADADDHDHQPVD